MRDRRAPEANIERAQIEIHPARMVDWSAEDITVTPAHAYLQLIDLYKETVMSLVPVTITFPVAPSCIPMIKCGASKGTLGMATGSNRTAKSKADYTALSTSDSSSCESCENLEGIAKNNQRLLAWIVLDALQKHVENRHPLFRGP